MSRYIDADILEELVEEEFDGIVCYDVPPDEAVDDICDIINSCPTADVAPVVHGRWEVVYNSVGKQEGQCTHCGKNSGILITKKSYCPNCGAKMDESEDKQ